MIQKILNAMSKNNWCEDCGKPGLYGVPLSTKRECTLEFEGNIRYFYRKKFPECIMCEWTASYHAFMLHKLLLKLGNNSSKREYGQN